MVSVRSELLAAWYSLTVSFIWFWERQKRSSSRSDREPTDTVNTGITFLASLSSSLSSSSVLFSLSSSSSLSFLSPWSSFGTWVSPTSGNNFNTQYSTVQYSTVQYLWFHSPWVSVPSVWLPVCRPQCVSCPSPARGGRLGRCGSPPLRRHTYSHQSDVTPTMSKYWDIEKLWNIYLFTRHFFFKTGNKWPEAEIQ